MIRTSAFRVLLRIKIIWCKLMYFIWNGIFIVCEAMMQKRRNRRV